MTWHSLELKGANQVVLFVFFSNCLLFNLDALSEVLLVAVLDCKIYLGKRILDFLSALHVQPLHSRRGGGRHRIAAVQLARVAARRHIFRPRLNYLLHRPIEVGVERLAAPEQSLICLNRSAGLDRMLRSPEHRDRGLGL